MNQWANGMLKSNAWSFEAVFPLRKMLKGFVVALNPYQARGGFCALQLCTIKCFPGEMEQGSSGGWQDMCRLAGHVCSLQPCMLFAALLGLWKISFWRAQDEESMGWSGHGLPFLQFLPLRQCPTVWGPKYRLPEPDSAWDSTSMGHVGRIVSLWMILVDAPGSQLTSVMSSTYRLVSRCLQRALLNFDILNKDVNTSLQEMTSSPP